MKGLYEFVNTQYSRYYFTGATFFVMYNRKTSVKQEKEFNNFLDKVKTK